MLSSDKAKVISTNWTILYIATTILKTYETANGNIDPTTDQILESTIIEVSKSLLQLNNGQWD
jgi:hypothetical protein